jgi:hypothetical protein
MREFQRAHESLRETTKRLIRKYGQDEFISTALQVYEEAKGINYSPPAKESVKLISVAQASEDFRIPHSTLVSWVVEGLLHNVGKWEAPSQPGRGIVLVDPHEVEKLRKKLGVGEEVAQPKLLTLKEAAQIHDLPYGTLRTWHQSGRLPVKGREIFHTKGGGKILVDEKDVIHLKNHRTPKRKTAD